MGKKIKTLSKILIILGVCVFAVLTVRSFLKYYDDRSFTVYADSYETNGRNPYISDTLVQRGYRARSELLETIYCVCGLVGCFLGGLPLYWFGCLFEKVEMMETKIDHLNKRQ